MVENFEFEETKKVRKSLIIISLIGIILKYLIKYSSGNIEFLGFKIPVEDASFLTNFISIIISFYILNFIIRFLKDNIPQYYFKKIQSLRVNFEFRVNEIFIDDLKKETIENKSKKINKFFEISTFILDLVFPIVLGFVSLFILFK